MRVWYLMVMVVLVGRMDGSYRLIAYHEQDTLLAGRIYKHIALLEEFNKQNKQLELVDIKKMAVTITDRWEYEHELVNLCAKKIIIMQSLDPLLETWRIFWNAYQHIDKLLFIYDFSLLLFSLYDQCLSELGRSPGQDYFEKIAELHERIAQLPINEVLDALEKCYMQLIEILKDYDLLNPTVSWSSWIEKNWWVPPVALASLLYSIFHFRSYTVAQNVVQAQEVKSDAPGYNPLKRFL